MNNIDVVTALGGAIFKVNDHVIINENANSFHGQIGIVYELRQDGDRCSAAFASGNGGSFDFSELTLCPDDKYSESGMNDLQRVNPSLAKTLKDMGVKV